MSETSSLVVDIANYKAEYEAISAKYPVGQERSQMAPADTARLEELHQAANAARERLSTMGQGTLAQELDGHEGADANGTLAILQQGRVNEQAGLPFLRVDADPPVIGGPGPAAVPVVTPGATTLPYVPSGVTNPNTPNGGVAVVPPTVAPVGTGVQQVSNITQMPGNVGSALADATGALSEAAAAARNVVKGAGALAVKWLPAAFVAFFVFKAMGFDMDFKAGPVKANLGAK